MSEIPMREATETEAREAVMAVLKFNRRWAIRGVLIMGGNLLIAAWDAYWMAHDLAHHYRFLAVFMALASLVGVWSAGRCWPMFILNFRLWQMHCLMLETFVKPPPADRP
jgi:hypothetical protein